MNNIKRLRKLNDLTQKQLAEKLSRTQPYINQWEREERKPNVEDLIKMSEIFDVSIDEILGTVPLFSNAETYSTDSEQVLRPILGVVKAGYDLYCEENIEGYKPVDKKKAAGAECFWLRVSGNSMNSVGIFDGALVLKKESS